jgi:glycosyltransferase involved in cell wall biosynthesis
VSEFFRKTGAGVVVDRPNPDLLAQVMENIASDDALRDRLIANARRVAPEFHVEKACEAFWSALSSIGP